MRVIHVMSNPSTGLFLSFQRSSALFILWFTTASLRALDREASRMQQILDQIIGIEANDHLPCNLDDPADGVLVESFIRKYRRRFDLLRREF